MNALLSPLTDEERLEEDTERRLLNQMKFWHEVFGLELEDATEIGKQRRRLDFNWPIFVPHGIRVKDVIEKSKEYFKVDACFQDAEAAIAENVRDNSDRSYVVWARRDLNADAWMGISCHELENKGVNGITLLERLILGLWFYWRSKFYLDRYGSTLCPGTTFVGGSVPRVSWDRTNEVLLIRWASFTGEHPYSGTREVVA